MMYSQCPQCQAVFNVSESHLGAYHGLVRCGHCQAVFDAVANELPDARTTFNQAPESDQSDVFDDNPAVDSRSAGRRAPEPVRDHDAAPESERIEPVLASDEKPDVEDKPEADSASVSPGSELPGEITEEILIEAPPVMSGSFDDEVPVVSTGDTEDVNDAKATSPAAPAKPGGAADAPPAPRDATPPSSDGGIRSPAPDSRAARAPLQSPYRARDIRMVELPQPRPFKTATLSLSVVLLALLLVWQGKTFYLDALAQEPLLRPYLERICRPLACVLPPRRDFARIEVGGTSIDVNPEVPGALEIRIALVNRAHFPQPYPPLRVTLSDSEGRIVGRRTYPPSEYLDDGKRKLLPIRQTRDAVINLAQPPQRVVGYEIELVAPRGGAG